MAADDLLFGATVPGERAGSGETGRPSPDDTPKRIQLRRTKGWRKPEGAIVVARPSKWGNPFTIAGAIESEFASDEAAARVLCVEAFRSVIRWGMHSEWWHFNNATRIEWMRDHLGELRGHDLACWCPLDQPCHADVLLELANA